MSYELHKSARDFLKDHYSHGHLERAYKTLSVHSGAFYTVVNLKMRPFVTNREFLSRTVWKRIDADTFTVVYVPEEMVEFPHDPRYIRADTSIMWKYKRLAPVEGVPQTHATFYAQVDLKGCKCGREALRACPPALARSSN